MRSNIGEKEAIHDFFDLASSDEIVVKLLEGPTERCELVDCIDASETTIQKRLQEGLKLGLFTLPSDSTAVRYSLQKELVPEKRLDILKQLREIHEGTDFDQIHRDNINDSDKQEEHCNLAGKSSGYREDMDIDHEYTADDTSGSDRGS